MSTTLSDPHDVPLEGRVGFQLADVSHYKDNPFMKYSTESERIALNENLTKPFPNELFIDGDNNIYVCRTVKDPDTETITGYEYISQTKNMADKFDYLEKQGVVNQVMATYNNGKTFNFYLDHKSGLMYPNESLIFPTDYKYYTVQSVPKAGEASNKYVAGIITDDGYGYNIAMQEIKDGDDETIYTKMRSGFFFSDSDVENNPGYSITHMQSGFFYIVNFYNSADVIIESKVFQAIDAAFLNNDTMIPTNIVVDIEVNVTKNGYPMAGNTNLDGVTTYPIYVGESTDFIKYDIVAVYEDGRRRSISQYKDTKYLSVSGTVDTSTVGTFSEIDFEYTPILQNINLVKTETIVNPDNSIDTIVVEEGEYSSSITKTIRFETIQSNSDKIYKLIPVVWSSHVSENFVNNGIAVASADFRMKLYALTNKGIVRVRTDTLFNSLQFDIDGGTDTPNWKNKNDIVSEDIQGWTFGYDYYRQELIFRTSRENASAVYGEIHCRFNIRDSETTAGLEFKLTLSSDGSMATLSVDHEDVSDLFTDMDKTLENVVTLRKPNFAGDTPVFSFNLANDDTFGERYTLNYTTSLGNVVNEKPYHVELYLVSDSTKSQLTSTSYSPGGSTTLDGLNTLSVPTSVSNKILTLINGVVSERHYLLVKFYNLSKSVCTGMDTFRIMIDDMQ